MIGKLNGRDVLTKESALIVASGAVLSASPGKTQEEPTEPRVAAFLEGRRLRLHPEKTRILETGAPAAFLGFVLLPGGRRHLPEENMRRFRNRLRALRNRWRAGRATREEIERRVGAWIAHAEHADTRRLRRAIFRDGWFDPSFHPSRGPGRPPAGAFCAAAPGTTNRGTSAPPTATGTTPETATTVSALPARSAAGAGALTGAPGAHRMEPSSSRAAGSAPASGDFATHAGGKDRTARALRR